MADRSHTRLPGSAGVRKYDPSAQEAPDTRQMLHDMKTEARKLDPYEPFQQPVSGVFRSARATRDDIQRIDPSTWSEEASAEDLTSADMKLASGVYEGAGGYKYEVMPGGEIKILQAPGGRGVGVTLRLGHPAHEAIFGELSESGASPKSAAPAEEPDAFGETMAGRRSRSSLGGAMAGDGSIAGGGPSQMPTASPAAFAKK